MERDDNILSSILKNFLNSNLHKLYTNGQEWDFDEIRNHWAVGVAEDQDLINWHLVLFISEFIIDKQLMCNFISTLYRVGDPATVKNKTLQSTDYLTRTGQLFYEDKIE